MLKVKTLVLLLLISVNCIQASRAPGGPAMSNVAIPARNNPGQNRMREYQELHAQQIALAAEARRQEEAEAARAKGSADRDTCDELCASLGLTRKAMIFDMEQNNGSSSRGSSEKGFIKQCVCE